MKICASLGTLADAQHTQCADLAEVRLDLLRQVPPLSGEAVVTYRGQVDLSLLPAGYQGLIDIGEAPLPATKLRIIRSHHDYEQTPDADAIAERMMSAEKGVYIVKGAYAIKSLGDLHSLFEASRHVARRHILLGMGELGAVTRLRSELLGNEFTFAYVSQPTAPGQLSVAEMRRLGDHCLLTGIVGHPLSQSLSPLMHNAAFRAAGLNGAYLRFDSPTPEHLAEVLREYDIRGVNVTVPHKEAVLDQLDRISPEAGAIGAVNTIVNDRGRLSGENTDVIGILAALDSAGFRAEAGKKVLIMGSGGAARACAYILRKKGCRTIVAARNPLTSTRLVRDLGCELVNPAQADVSQYDLIVNSTPIGMYDDSPYPVSLAGLSPHQTVLDMVYGHETSLTRLAHDVGARCASGVDMLVAQGAASFELWTGRGGLEPVMKGALQ